MTDARTAILARLRAAPPRIIPDLPPVRKPWGPADETAKDRFIRLMTAVKGEIIEIRRMGFVDALKKLLADKGVGSLLYGPDSEIAVLIAGREAELPQLVAYDRPVSEFKERLFNEIDAAITSTKGATADTGSLIVWPSPAEPRLMSVVPPLHIAVLEESKIMNSFTDAVSELGWTENMPANSVLISGPSKTADIEGILCYGVHGPKQLAILLITD